MKSARFTWLMLLIFTSACFAQTVVIGGSSTSGVVLGTEYTSIDYASAPDFPIASAKAIQGFTIPLTDNVTSSTFSGTPEIGQLVYLKVCEPAAGGKNFVFPPSVAGQGAIDKTANACTTQGLQWDGTNWNGIGSSSDGGSGSSGLVGSNGLGLTLPPGPDAIPGMLNTYHSISGAWGSLDPLGPTLVGSNTNGACKRANFGGTMFGWNASVLPSSATVVFKLLTRAGNSLPTISQSMNTSGIGPSGNETTGSSDNITFMDFSTTTIVAGNWYCWVLVTTTGNPKYAQVEVKYRQ